MLSYLLPTWSPRCSDTNHQEAQILQHNPSILTQDVAYHQPAWAAMPQAACCGISGVHAALLIMTALNVLRLWLGYECVCCLSLCPMSMLQVFKEINL